MIADDRRGDAWTNALFGLQAKEIHLCGDERAHKLIEKLCERSGDDFEAIEYKRLSVLEVEESHIKSVDDLREGDCIVAFGREKLFSLKQIINRIEAGRRKQARNENKSSEA